MSGDTYTVITAHQLMKVFGWRLGNVIVMVEGAEEEEEEEQEGEETTMRKRRRGREGVRAGEKEGYERRGTDSHYRGTRSV